MDVGEKSETNLADQILRRHSGAVTPALQAALDRLVVAAPKLKEAIAYSVFAGGKRLRPALVLESCIACGGGADDRSALAAAVAIELIHTFSLVHDDLPAMDDDDLRRGRPTNHKVFGEALAILAGDAMVALAFETIALDARPQIVGPLVRELAMATSGMIDGQSLDIDAENESLTLNQLQKIHHLKTGALLVCACRMGAIAAGAGNEMLAAMTAFGDHLGLAFQIMDDVLDVTSTPEQLGKKTHKDAGSGKNTYPRILGIDASRAAAKQHVDAAIAALKDVARSDGLRAIAIFVIARQF